MAIKFTNNASGVLASSITNSATSISLTTGQGALFPALSAGDFFYATLVDSSNNLEIVKVTDRSTDTLTVTRAQDNTTARAFTAGDKLELRPVAAVFSEFVQVAGDQSIAGVKTFTGGVIYSNSLILNNEVNILAKDSGGTERPLIRLNNGNNVLFCNAGNGSILVRNQADNATLVTLTDASGNFTASGNVTAYSDERLKENIQVIQNALAKVQSVRGVTFDRKEDGVAGIGVIAQEIQKIAPEAVVVDESGMLSVAYGNLVGLLIEAVKELNEKVEKLERSI